MGRHYTEVMFHKTCFIVLLMFYFNCQTILGQLTEQKRSLIFAIDDTNSMSDDIQQVKITAKSILDTVINSKETQIGNFVLVRFSDPDVKPAFITTNKEEYIRALDSIVVGGGGDCPELSMKGIEEALDKGLPRSYLFVFTDASAKDYGNFETVKSLAQKKSSQIIFVLTGVCTTKEDPAYQVYHKLATATSGQVFDVDKNEVSKVLEYVKEIVEFPRTDLGTNELGPGYGHTIHFPSDDMIGNVIISISGQAPRVEVQGPDGTKPVTSVIVQTANVMVIKINSPRPGTYTVIVGSLSVTTIVITGATTFDFLYGFSSWKPASIEDTETRPVAGIPLYLAIEPHSPGNIVELKEVNLVDLNKNVLKVIPLNKVRDDFYVTEPFVAPDTMFKIMIKGVIKLTNIPVQRISATPIEPQKPVPPTIIDDGKSVVSTDHGKIVNLDCVANGVPRPAVKWTYNGGNIEFTHTIFKNNTLSYKASVPNAGNFSCEATNQVGSARKNVVVIVYGAPMITPPKQTRLQKIVGCSLTLTCEVIGFPKPTIKWLYHSKDTKEGELRTTDDAGSLHIPRLEFSHSGSYVCLAENSLGSANVTYTVDVLYPPTIEKTPNNKLTAVVDDLVLKLPCSASGNPAPLITWTKDGFFIPSGRNCYFNSTFEIESDGSLLIMDIDMTSDGKYICLAENEAGNDVDIINVNVLKTPPPGTPEKTIKVEVGTSSKINCDIPNIRTDILRWYKDSKLIASGNLTLKNAQLSDQGIYTCRVSTLSGSSSASVYVEVGSKPKFIYNEGGNVDFHLGEQIYLSCSARGVPIPKVSWKFNGKSLDVATMVLSFTVSEADIGRYDCVVTNDFGTITREYNIVKSEH